MEQIRTQQQICDEYSSKYIPIDDDLTLGISYNFDIKQMPINGLRHPPENGTNGWYIWSGENFSDDDDFFVPIHVYHIKEKYPVLYKFLCLEPGFRFLLGPNGYIDIWTDESLLNV